MMRIAILASGNGTNAQSIFEHIGRGALRAKVVRVLSNKPEAPVLERADRAGIPTWARDHKEFATRRDFAEAMLDELGKEDVDCIVLAGYMRLLSPEFLAVYAGRTVNIHPALLPAFPGAKAPADALLYGVKMAGCTVHFVEEMVDSGPIIIQAAVPVLPDDTPRVLQSRINICEHRIYPQALQWLAEGRVSVRDRRVSVLPPHGSDLGETTGSIRADGVPCLVWPPLEKGF